MSTITLPVTADPALLAWGPTLKAAGLGLYVILASATDPTTGCCTLPTAHLAARAGISDREAKRLLHQYAAWELLSIEPRFDSAGRQLPNCYRLLPVPPAPNATGGPPDSSGPAAPPSGRDDMPTARPDTAAPAPECAAADQSGTNPAATRGAAAAAPLHTQCITSSFTSKTKTVVCATSRVTRPPAAAGTPAPGIGPTWRPDPALEAEVRTTYRGDDIGFAFQVAGFRDRYSSRPLAQAPALFRWWMRYADPAKEPRHLRAQTPLPAAVVTRPQPQYFRAAGWNGGERR